MLSTGLDRTIAVVEIICFLCHHLLSEFLIDLYDISIPSLIESIIAPQSGSTFGRSEIWCLRILGELRMFQRDDFEPIYCENFDRAFS